MENKPRFNDISEILSTNIGIATSINYSKYNLGECTQQRNDQSHHIFSQDLTNDPKCANIRSLDAQIAQKIIPLQNADSAQLRTNPNTYFQNDEVTSSQRTVPYINSSVNAPEQMPYTQSHQIFSQNLTYNAEDANLRFSDSQLPQTIIPFEKTDSTPLKINPNTYIHSDEVTSSQRTVPYINSSVNVPEHMPHTQSHQNFSQDLTYNAEDVSIRSSNSQLPQTTIPHQNTDAAELRSTYSTCFYIDQSTSSQIEMPYINSFINSPEQMPPIQYGIIEEKTHLENLTMSTGSIGHGEGTLNNAKHNEGSQNTNYHGYHFNNSQQRPPSILRNDSQGSESFNSSRLKDLHGIQDQYPIQSYHYPTRNLSSDEIYSTTSVQYGGDPQPLPSTLNTVESTTNYIIDKSESLRDLDPITICRRNSQCNCTTCTTQKIDTVSEKSYCCPFHDCQMTFNNIWNLKNHIRTHSSECPFKCTFCGKTFSGVGDLKQHTRVHTDVLSFMCSICGMAFDQQSTLTQHTRIHRSERNFKCTTCEMAFSNQGNLMQHTIIHWGEKPRICYICLESFDTIDLLSKHQNSKHVNKGS